MAESFCTITVDNKGFLWWKGMKLNARLVPGGIEFKEKDCRRAAQAGGPLFVVPFEALLALSQVHGVVMNTEVIEVEGKDGEP